MATAAQLNHRAKLCDKYALDVPAEADRFTREANALRAEANLITARADRVSPRRFFDAVTGRSDAIRAAERERMIEDCIRAVERGSTYGWPPAMVAIARDRMEAGK